MSNNWSQLSPKLVICSMLQKQRSALLTNPLSTSIAAGLPAPPRTAADTMAHSSGAAISSQSRPAANMVADLPKTTNVVASITPCIAGWDSVEP
uniref:Uncharacterized protein n=1 Tax=Romanomermis culicivorax TaxID=13658 RepID=A0A915JPC1_ROMCU